MIKAALRTIEDAVDAPKNFTDVLYLTRDGQIPPEIKRFLKNKKLSLASLPIEKFSQIRHRLDLIGTVIIDAKGLGTSQQDKLAQIVESFEMKGIGAILLNNRVQVPVRSFSLAGHGVKSFSLASTMESVSIDELWVRISINLAYRERGSEILVKPAVPPKQLEYSYDKYRNKLAEQLRIRESFVDNLTEQLRLAGLVQKDFLPTQLPNTDRFQWATIFLPAEWVSGDIYDIAKLDEKHIGFYVADAVGHSMPAALLTMFIKQALVMRRTIGNDYRVFSPKEVVKSLNQRMTKQKLSGYQFATCCYGLINTESLELTFARAGHPYPILIRKDEHPRQLEIAGSLLGIFEQAEYEEQTIQLQAGDKVLFYSDGAEPFIPFIHSFDELTGYDFKEEFDEIKGLSIVEMLEKFNAVVRNKHISPAEIDDITAVGLEVL
ncbi:MAG: serine/threonine-protein phosphatase [Sedimentisphaerales bacterium]|nr:serine/threonine-protein phosphatase [Sedimentisphaerales bacterium]